MHGFKKFTVVMVVVLALALGVGAASAQGGGGGSRGHEIAASGALVNALAELTDMSSREVMSAWEEGMTLEELAASYDISTDDLIAEATTNATAQLDARVELGRITQDEADALLATLTESFDEALTTPRELPTRPDGDQGLGLGGRFDGDLVDSISEALGLTPAEITEQITAGATLGDILEAQGVDAQTIVDLVTAQAQERTAAAVEDGRITQEQADELLANLETHINDVLENGLPIRDLLGNGPFNGRDGFGGRGGPRGGQGGFGGGFGPNAQPPASAPAGSDA